MTIGAPQGLSTLPLEEKRELLKRLLREKNQVQHQMLSFPQEQLWLSDQMGRAGAAYNLSIPLRFRGSLDITAVSDCLARIVARQDSLRTVFRLIDEQPRQLVLPSVKIVVNVIDFHTTMEDQAAYDAGGNLKPHLVALVRKEATYPFDLEKGPLLRFNILRFSGCEHLCLFNLHHIITDGWSTEIFIKEFGELYGAYLENRPANLPSLPIQYLDFAYNQRKTFTESLIKTRVDYWRQLLCTVPERLLLPVDYPRPATPSFRGSKVFFKWDAAFSEELKQAARLSRVTLFITLLAGYAAILSRYSGQKEVVIGTPNAGRNDKNLANLIGFFVQSTIMAIDLSGDPDFPSLLQLVRERLKDTFLKGEVPLAKIVSALRPQASTAFNPIFQVWLVFHGEHESAVSLPLLTVNHLNIESDISKFDLSISFTNAKTGLHGYLEYNTDVFTATSMHRFLDHLRLLLGQMTASPNTPISRHSLLRDDLRRDVLTRWNYQQQEPINTSFDALFCNHAQSLAEQPAMIVVGESGKQTIWSYASLQRQAWAVTQRLKSLGLEPNSPIGICLPHEARANIAILGTLLAGCYYIPLDPAQPDPRLALMIADSGINWVLTCKENLERLSLLGVEATSFDPDQEAELPDVFPSWDPNFLAYVIYTSGTTGKPKGVAISHGNLCHYINGLKGRWQLPIDAQLATTAAYFTDLGHTAVFGALGTGRTLRVISGSLTLDAQALAKNLKHCPVEFLKTTPSHLAVLLEGGGADVLPRHTLFLGGEALSPKLVQRLGEVAPNLQVVNHYGPTETTVGIATFALNGPLDTISAPIGRALPNACALVVDKQMQLQPPGLPGELLLGGLGLTRGYLAAPAITAATIIPDPFSRVPGARLYRSGDLARLLPDGNLMFIGRLDHQVKIRGHRVELGELESLLAKAPGVEVAAVLLRTDKLGHQHLAAFMSVLPNRQIRVEELALYAASNLPAHMVPTTFTILEEIPLTANGKINRKALPEEDETPKLEFIPPRNEREEILCAIWKDVLGRDQIGVHDNFFALGGDSILSVLAVAQARKKGLHLTPTEFFDKPTVAGLAALTKEVAGTDFEAAEGMMPLMPIQAWFFELNLQLPHHFNQAVLIQSEHPFDGDLLEQAVSHLIAHHDALRLRVNFEETPPLLGFAKQEQGMVLEFIDHVHVPERDQAALLADSLAEIQGQLNLVSGPILKLLSINLGNGEYRLLFVVHHLAIDGVSWRILLDDFCDIYTSLQRGETPRPLPRTSSFQAWSQALRRQDMLERFSSQSSYWQQIISAPVPPIPQAVLAPNLVADSRSIEVVLPKQDSLFLVSAANEAFRTRVDDILLTALLRAFNRFDGRRQLRFTMESHGRQDLFPELDINRTVGWFTTTYPVLLTFDPNQSPIETLLEVKRTLREIPDNGIGFGILKYLAADTNLTREPMPEMIFNNLGQVRSLASEVAGFSLANEHPGPLRAPQQQRTYVIDIVCIMHEDQLRTSFSFSHKRLDSERVQGLADAFADELASVLALCAREDLGALSCEDVPELALSQPALDALVRDIGAHYRAVVPESTFHPARAIQAIYPVSPLQQGMLYHSMLAPATGIYVGQQICELRGKLNIAALRDAWAHVQRRHTIFRTLFHDLDNQPVQAVFYRVPLPWVYHDWRHHSEQAQHQALAAYLAEDRLTDFNFERPPLMRLFLAQLSEDCYRFVWTRHHALTDGWTTALILGEVMACYQAFALGQQPRLPEPTPFGHFIRWLAGRDHHAATAFWKHYLADVVEPTPMVMEKRRAKTVNAELDMHFVSTSLPELTSSGLRALVSRKHTTLNALAQWGWGRLLSYYTGNLQVTFGVTVSGRPSELPDVEHMVGPFINTLPFKLVIHPTTKIFEEVKALHQQMQEVEAHGYLPLVEIKRASKIKGEHPLFEALFVFENYPPNARIGNQTTDLLIRVENAREKINYPIAMVVIPDREIVLQLGYDANRFDQALMERLLGHFAKLLNDMGEGPNRTAGSLDPLSLEERHTLLHDFNATQREVPHTYLFHQQLEDRAKICPEAIAANHAGQSITYKELNSNANRLARLLRLHGVVNETVIPVLGDRSISFLTGFIAILKAGGSYLPLDPKHPQTRLARILSIARPGLLLAQPDQNQLAKEALALAQVEAPVLPLRAPSEGEDQDLDGPIHSDQLAYVIFTSGSTGLPKGAMVTHQGMNNHLHAKIYDLNLSAEDNVAQTASQCFDISVWQFLVALILGGRVKILDNEHVLDPARLLHAFDDVTIAELVPSILRLFLEQAREKKASCLSTLRWMIPTGEALPPELARQWLDAFPHIPLLNAYGPTECSDDVSHHPLHCPPESEVINIPIGKPIINTRLYVIGRHGLLQPLGIPGEILVGGQGVGRGYFNDPGRTARVFVPNPFAIPESAGDRLYKTGDLARVLANGNLEFMGRTDYQVKIRGFRMELGEIEAVILEHPDITDVVVVAKPAADCQTSLVAYYVASPANPSHTFREYLRERLPDYMLPSIYVQLPKLPLTPNGKIDRKALPEPDQPLLQHLIHPKNATEVALAEIWKDVLQLSTVGVHSNFFELGGHSLLLIQVRRKIQQRFSRELPVVDLFKFPTIFELAKHLEGRDEKLSQSMEIQATAATRRAAFDKQRQHAKKRRRQ